MGSNNTGLVHILNSPTRKSDYPTRKSNNLIIKSDKPTKNETNNFIKFSSEYSFEPIIIVELFNEVFKYILYSPNLQGHIQNVKKELYNRHYLSAFDNDDKRFAYVSRWSPARALSYSSLFASLSPIRKMLENPNGKRKVLCIGGGASSELVGLASIFCRLKEYNSSSDSNLELNIVDIADWSTVIKDITNYIKSNWIYHSDKFNTKFINDDILTIGISDVFNYYDLNLITLLFTTNELFCEKRGQTVKFLQTLNSKCSSGTYLLVAESAGSYSHITIGNKKFPTQFLIDTILVGKSGNDGDWKIISKSESCWYRIDPKEIDYKLKLENMRFFYRLYIKK